MTLPIPEKRLSRALTRGAALLLVLFALPFGLSTAAGQTGDSFSLLLSTSPDRSNPIPLAGASVDGNAYVFVSPEAGATLVRFWVDNPAMSGTPRTTERNPPWDLAGGNSDGTARPFDTTGLADGSHTVTAAVSLSAGGTEVVTAEFTVANGGEPPPPPPPPPPPGGSFGLFASASPDRSAPAALAGQSLKGNAYVFVLPEAGATQVRFWVDRPSMTGTPYKTEKNAPWDLAGGKSDGTALPFDTTKLADGPHTVTAAVDVSGGGTEVATAEFLVANAGPSLVFDRSTLSLAGLAGGASTTHSVGVRASDGAGAAFSVSDSAAWLAVSPAAGTAPRDLLLTANPAGLTPGNHGATVTVSAPGYAPALLSVSLYVRTSLVPDQVHLAWVNDPSTTLTVLWRTWATSTPSSVQFRRPEEVAWQTATGGLRPSGTDGTLHEVTLTGLAPDTEYDYRVRADDGTWSAAYRTNTAPAPGPADFDAVYVADTGLVGRSDGLATGTQQVVDEIAALDPDLVLLGGDYAYYNTDTRYGSLDATIDAWFDQMQPVGSQAPMMVSYGNHEILLGEGFEFWAPRFATPAGFDGRRFYSFDVGDVHFVSIFAVSDTAGLTSSALQWIEQDMQAARQAGQRWIVPFFHVSPFSDGKNHPSNLKLREQLGPIFERQDVKVALSSHDQSYERTFPLTGVPATNTPTSTGKRCYTMEDGVTWVKVSPGGKLSNKNQSFSQWATNPAPRWTAYRDNTAHHFSRLSVSASGTLRLDTYAVSGNGAPPAVIDTFEYRAGGCPAELALGADDLSFALDPRSGPAAQTLGLQSSGGASASYSVTDDADWLTVTPAAGTTPASLTVSVDPAGLAPGTYRGTVTATADGHVSDATTVTLVVYDLLVSTATDRSGGAVFAGGTVSGKVAIFLAPDAGPTQVRFYRDDPGMTKTPTKVEKNAPWDFAGSASDGSAILYDTTRIADGTHTITAAVDFPGGVTKVLTSTFTVSNASP